MECKNHQLRGRMGAQRDRDGGDRPKRCFMWSRKKDNENEKKVK